MGTSRASKNLIYRAMGKENLVAGAKNIAKTIKLVGYDFPKEIAKRAIIPGYADRKIFGPSFRKK